MPKKKSHIRQVGKKTLLFLNVIISFLILYPIYLNPISLIWVNGFLGLIAPYLLLFEIFFLFFWLIVKPLLTLPSLLTLIFSWKLFIIIIGWHPGVPFHKTKKENTLRIISWNVKGFNGLVPNTTMKFRTQEISYSIQKWNPDIICMQEYNTNEKKDDIANHTKYFEKQYPYSFFSKDYQSNDSSYYAGCIIYSKYKIIHYQRYPFSNNESLIAATILKGDDTIQVFTTHLASYRFKQDDFEAIDDASKNKWGVVRKMKHAFEERAVQSEIVKTQINASKLPTIITGDFNDVPGSYAYHQIATGWKDAFLEKGFGVGDTFLGISPTLRIDYILVNSHWEVKAWEQIDENLSDHHMIMADLMLKKQ